MAGTASFADILDDTLEMAVPPAATGAPALATTTMPLLGGVLPNMAAAVEFEQVWGLPLGAAYDLGEAEGTEEAEALVVPIPAGDGERPTAPGRAASPAPGLTDPAVDGLDIEWRPFREVPCLSPTQQQAFERFSRHGARLDAGFTATELRSAYRRLARRFHPDRHAATGTADAADLARTFARLTDDYALLQQAAC